MKEKKTKTVCVCIPLCGDIDCLCPLHSVDKNEWKKHIKNTAINFKKDLKMK